MPDATGDEAAAQPGVAGETDAEAPGRADGAVALVVDDEDRVRAMIVEILTRAGFSCLEAIDAEQALTLLDAHSPRLGVLDLTLPGMSGAELAWRIRSRMPDVPLVALSGHLAEWDGDDLKDLGFDRIFAKPMNCDEFVEFCVQRCFGLDA